MSTWRREITTSPRAECPPPPPCWPARWNYRSIGRKHTDNRCEAKWTHELKEKAKGIYLYMRVYVGRRATRRWAGEYHRVTVAGSLCCLFIFVSDCIVIPRCCWRPAGAVQNAELFHFVFPIRYVLTSFAPLKETKRNKYTKGKEEPKIGMSAAVAKEALWTTVTRTMTTLSSTYHQQCICPGNNVDVFLKRSKTFWKICPMFDGGTKMRLFSHCIISLASFFSLCMPTQQ